MEWMDGNESDNYLIIVLELGTRTLTVLLLSSNNIIEFWLLSLLTVSYRETVNGIPTASKLSISSVLLLNQKLCQTFLVLSRML